MMVLTMKNFNYKNIKTVEKIHLLLLLFIIMSKLDELYRKHLFDKSVFADSVCVKVCCKS